MKTLAVDTSTMMATCAVLDGNYLLGEFSLNQDMSHAENLIPMIKEVLDNLKLEPKDIDLYGVAIGPGSFTGLRIGVATVKSFAHVFDRPIIGVSSLEGLAFNLPYNGIVVPMIDARRDRVYTGIYEWKGNNLINIMEPCIMYIEDLLDTLQDYENIIINGNGVYLHKDRILNELDGKAKLSPIGSNECRASSIGELAIKKYNKGIRDNYYTLVPEYLKESQAQRDFKKKEG